LCMGFVIADETRFVRVVFARCVTRREFGVVRFREPNRTRSRVRRARRAIVVETPRMGGPRVASV
jgi:hypothetical protein